MEYWHPFESAQAVGMREKKNMGEIPVFNG